MFGRGALELAGAGGKAHDATGPSATPASTCMLSVAAVARCAQGVSGSARHVVAQQRRVLRSRTVPQRRADSRLQEEFGEQIGMDTIDKFLNSSYDHFAARATIPNFVPLLAERFTRQQLHALSRIEDKGADGKPTVLFLCTHNAGRSQMALGFFTELAGAQALAWSGGSEPATELNASAVDAMAEVVSTSPGSSPNPGPTRLCRPPTWSSQWVAAIPARCFPASVMRNGSCPTRPAKRLRPFDRSATTSNNASDGCSPNWTSLSQL